MFELIQRIPEPWRQLTDLLIVPLAWIPRMQHTLWDFFFAPGPWWLVVAKFIFLAFPALLAIAAVWCTQLSIYTLPFRSGRVHFIPTMMLTWWDAVRDVIRQIALMPFTMTGRMTQTYFTPGVPWVAFVMLIFWCVLEAAIFSYTLMPTVTELLADLVGGDSTARYTGPILYFFLLLLIMGSFACVQTLMEAVKKREWKFIVQMVAVEAFVMFFEVMFLYRELIDALTPWIAQQTGMKMGLAVTLSLSAFGWIGIRGMTWFLFGQYGTPPLLAFISRRPIGEEGDPRLANAKPAVAWWRQPVEELKREIEWLHARSEELVDYLVLPVLQITAAALNFGMVLVASRQVFSLPFKDRSEITQTWHILQTLHMQATPRKQATL